MLYKAACLALALQGATAAPVKNNNRRKLSYSLIANYAPGSQVTDHNAVDLDQDALQDAISNDDFALAGNIYAYGGNSKVYAQMTLAETLDASIAEDDVVTGTALDGTTQTGTVKKLSPFQVIYDTKDTQTNWNGGCTGVYSDGTGADVTDTTSGCIGAGGTITVANADAGSPFTYTVSTSLQMAGRTLKGFSTGAGAKMYSCSASACPYKDYLQYYTYYGDLDYADKWVTGALNNAAVDFTGAAADDITFVGVGDNVKGQAIKKGTAYMNVYMYVLREFYDAIDDCNAGDLTRNDAPVHAWDEGVAFYAGTLASTDGSTYGVMLYNLADKRCENFKTCGVDGDSTTKSAHAKVNHELKRTFGLGQYYAVSGQCNDAISVLEDIVAQMSVPLIQGTLRYAYKVAYLSGATTEKAEGVTFAAAILPRVHFCSPTDAATIRDNMKLTAASTDFAAVKTAFENNYACMNITCADIGGLWFSSNDDYYEHAEPCSDVVPVDPTTITVTETELSTGGLIGMIVGIALAVVFLLCIIMIYCKEKSSGKPVFYSLEGKSGAAA
jgi:hypothetical protein